MKNHYAGQARVPMDEAKRRALSVLSADRPLRPSDIAATVFPDHQMKAQGAAWSVVNIMKALADDGLARWVSLDGSHGYILTLKGARL